jgi:hypothetical protein
MFNGYYGELFVLIALHSFYLDSGTACLQKTIYSFERKLLFDSMQKSPKFLLEIMRPVSSANIMGTDEVFSIGERSFI